MRGTASPRRTTDTSTHVPASPRSRFGTSPRGMPTDDTPSIATIRSPARMPARIAGPPDTTFTTTSVSCNMSYSIPTPPNPPSNCASALRISSAVR